MGPGVRQDDGGAYDIAHVMEPDMSPIHTFVLIAAAFLAGCVSEPPRYGEVVTMKASEAARVEGHPQPGTVWRLDEADLKALSPAPIVPAPPPPRRPPPPPRGYHYPPPPTYWAPPY